MKKLVFVLVLVFVLTGCASTRVATQLVHDIQRDTIYVSNFQYDSVYVFKDKYVDRTRDTLYIKDKSIEYRYKLLRDTVRVIQRDSIPYEVTIVKTKEITRPLTWFDKLCRICFGICLSGLLILLYKFIKHFWKGDFLKL